MNKNTNWMKVRISLIMAMVLCSQSVVPVSGANLISYNSGNSITADIIKAGVAEVISNYDFDFYKKSDDIEVDELCDDIMESQEEILIDYEKEDILIDNHVQSVNEVACGYEILNSEYENNELLNEDSESNLESLESIQSNEEWYKDFSYQMNGTMIQLSKYVGNAENVYIPEKTVINGKEYGFLLLERAFANCNTIKSVEIGDSKYYVDLDNAFRDCKNLQSVKIGKVIPQSMNETFKGCSSLTTVDISQVDTSKIDSLTGLFYECSSLKDVKLNGFDTSNIRVFQEMFYRCSSLTRIDLSGLNTSNATNMAYMFKGCNSLESLDLSNFVTSGIGSLEGLNGFVEGCNRLAYLDISNFTIPGPYYSVGGTRFLDLDLPSLEEFKSPKAGGVVRLANSFYCEDSELKNTLFVELDNSFFYNYGNNTHTFKRFHYVDRISFEESVLDLYAWQSQKLTAKIEPTNATDKNISWRSSNTSVAVVDQE